jgi:hypothetical protein
MTDYQLTSVTELFCFEGTFYFITCCSAWTKQSNLENPQLAQNSYRQEPVALYVLSYVLHTPTPV